MADYNQLKASIAAVIKTNNRKEITGQLLQNVLFQMTNVIGENYQLAGFATPQTNPHEPDQNVFYITDEAGTFPYFDNIILGSGISFLMWKNGQWTSHTVNGVTQEWVEENFVSIEFFRSLFRAYDSNGDEILPNNNPEGTLPAVVDSIKAMVGFWTEQYISALGHGTGGGGGGGGGATTLDGLDDVVILNPQNGQGLIYDAVSGKWMNQNIPTGTDMAAVWSALAGATNQQINISHLTDALASYATQTWVSQNYISIAYFDRLFRAYNGNTLVSHNDTTTTIDNIKAMFGFWTEYWVSALGNGGGLGSTLYLASLADIALSNPTDGQVLTYNASTGKWVNANAQAGVTDLASLTDVTLTTPAANQALIYDGTKWINSTLKTVNGYSLIGSGNIDASGGGTGNYVAKAGDTMTGMLTMNFNSNELIKLKRSSSGGAFIDYYSNNQQTYGWRVGSSGDHTMLYAYTSTGFGTDTVYLEILTNGNVGIGTRNPSQKLQVVGDVLAQRWRLSSGFMENASGNQVDLYCYNEHRVRLQMNSKEYGYAFSDWYFGPFSDASESVDLGRTNGRWKDFYTKSIDVSGTIIPLVRLKNSISDTGAFIDLFSSGQSSTGWRLGSTSDSRFVLAYTTNGFSSDSARFLIRTNGNIGINTTSPSYKLHVDGDIYATGAVTALSDVRKKDVLSTDIGLTVEQIADAPTIKFLWKDKRNEGIQVGSVAQFWAANLPEVVMDRGGELSMQYGVAALVSAIITARKVVDHERRISELEKENERLRTEVEQLRLN